MCVYIYIYLYREGDVHVCTCIYVYDIYICHNGWYTLRATIIVYRLQCSERCAVHRPSEGYAKRGSKKRLLSCDLNVTLQWFESDCWVS